MLKRVLKGNSPGFRPKLPRQTYLRAHGHQGEVGVGARRASSPSDPPPASPASPISPRRGWRARHDDLSELVPPSRAGVVSGCVRWRRGRLRGCPGLSGSATWWSVTW